MSDTSEEAPETVGQVVGQAVRTLRLDRRWTQQSFADRVVRCGLPWKRTQVSDLESGRRESLDVGTLIVLASALGHVPLADLVAGDGKVLLTPRADFPEQGVTCTRSELRKWLSGERASITLSGVQTGIKSMEHSVHVSREIPASLDISLAKLWNVDPWDVVNAAEALWNRSATEERDRRVAELGDLPIGERQARQGHITRELSAVLKRWLQLGEEPEGG